MLNIFPVFKDNALVVQTLVINDKCESMTLKFRDAVHSVCKRQWFQVVCVVLCEEVSLESEWWQSVVNIKDDFFFVKDSLFQLQAIRKTGAYLLLLYCSLYYSSAYFDVYCHRLTRGRGHTKELSFLSLLFLSCQHTISDQFPYKTYTTSTTTLVKLFQYNKLSGNNVGIVESRRNRQFIFELHAWKYLKHDTAVIWINMNTYEMWNMQVLVVFCNKNIHFTC